MAGQAIPSYAPKIAGTYFRKLECFCFQQQLLAGNETKRFPVVFVIDPKLPPKCTTITLSYTFFDVAGQVGKAPQPPSHVQREAGHDAEDAIAGVPAREPAPAEQAACAARIGPADPQGGCLGLHGHSRPRRA